LTNQTKCDTLNNYNYIKEYIIKEYILLLKYLLSYNNYNKYYSVLEKNIDTKELKFLYTCLTELHSLYKKDLSTEEFRLYVLAHCLDKDQPVYDALLTNVEGSTIDDHLISDVLVSLRNKKLAYELALISLDVSEGRSSIDKVFTAIEQFENHKPVEEFTFVTGDLNELYNETVKSQGLRWRLSTLNSMLGSLRKGDFGFIYARPESGKTTFLASEITHFAQQVSAPILWFNNEEQGNKVMLRCVQASLGLTSLELFSALAANQSAFNSNGGQNIKIFDSASIHRRQVEQLCKELSPALVIFDQIDKIKGFTDDREDLRLGSIYIWARELAKTYCPVIGVCQADASGEGKRWLTMENVANAKTAKQAEADWILGIGKTHDTSKEYIRHFHLSKNKLSGDEDTDPLLRHGRMDVLIRPEIARYQDMEN
jgi:hypothetical protein